MPRSLCGSNTSRAPDASPGLQSVETATGSAQAGPAAAASGWATAAAGTTAAEATAGTTTTAGTTAAATTTTAATTAAAATTTTTAAAAAPDPSEWHSHWDRVGLWGGTGWGGVRGCV